MDQSLARAAAGKRSFHTLDALRGIAAILVAALHYEAFVAPLKIGSGYLAVDVFFAMSGFVLAFAYEGRIAGGMSTGRFLLVRWVRLFPLYLAGTLIGIAIPVAGLLLGMSRGWNWSDLSVAALPAMVMLPAPPPELYRPDSFALNQPVLYPFNAPAWSLFFELIVNVFYAATLRLPQRIFLPLVIGISAIGLVATALVFGSIEDGWLWNGWWAGLFRVGFSFFVGVALYRLYASGRLPQLRLPPLVPLAGVALLLWIAVPEGPARMAYDLVCVLLVLPALVWLCVCSEPRRGVRAFAVLGLISYPLYVIHVPIAYLVGRVVDRLLQGQTEAFAPWIGAGIIAALVAVSWLLATSYDVWARQWLARRVGLVAPAIP